MVLGYFEYKDGEHWWLVQNEGGQTGTRVSNKNKREDMSSKWFDKNWGSLFSSLSLVTSLAEALTGIKSWQNI